MIELTLDERVMNAISVVADAKDLSKDMLMAFGKKGQDKKDRSKITGNYYRWLLRTDGRVLTWSKRRGWVSASQRMTKIIRMKVAPEYVW